MKESLFQKYLQAIDVLAEDGNHDGVNHFTHVLSNIGTFNN